jgi:tripartite-type tricarboxylate transporter receptor subunit TctC
MIRNIMIRNIRKYCSQVAVMLLSCTSVTLAYAQPYPSKPLHLIVPYAAGGGADIVARTLAQKLSESMGQQVVVDNRAGAAGNIGAALGAKAAPDGYTLLLITNTHATNASLYTKVGYELAKDFAPITLMSETPLILAVHPSLPARSVKELVAVAKSRPGQLHYSTGGNGSSAHTAAQLFVSMAGIDLVHVPYKGNVEQTTALMSGYVQLTFSTMSGLLPQVKAGRLRALAMTAAKRAPAAPDIPTIAESGYPGYEVINWTGVVVPTGTSKDIIAKLHTEFLKALGAPDVKNRYAGQGVEPVSSTPEEFAAFIRAELVRWGRVTKQSGARLD